MKKMMTKFKKDVKQVMSTYQHVFEDNNTSMSTERSNDIINIRGMLKQPYDNIDECIAQLAMFLKTFETGWWIFPTGRSRLRTNIQRIIKDYNNTLVRGLFEEVHALKTQHQQYKEAIELAELKRVPQGEQMFQFATRDECVHKVVELKKTQQSLRHATHANCQLKQKVQQLEQQLRQVGVDSDALPVPSSSEISNGAPNLHQ